IPDAPSGCQDWTGAKWASQPGSVELTFRGTAVYAYGHFDHWQSIYIVNLDSDPPVRLGEQERTAEQLCDPLYSKSGLSPGEHTIKILLTDEGVVQSQEVVFHGFIVTVLDGGDENTSGGNPTATTTGSGSGFNPTAAIQSGINQVLGNGASSMQVRLGVHASGTVAALKFSISGEDY
ncbi:5205_t:CDS:2, partial [Acaulospora colombiana]